MLRSIVFIIFILGFFISNKAFAETKSGNCLLIHDAQIKLPDNFDHPIFGHANYGHEVKSGNRSVILIRSVQNLHSAPDSQEFLKITLELKRLPGNFETDQTKEAKVSRSFYSKGSSGFVSNGAYAWARDVLKRIAMVQTPQGLVLTIDANLKLRRADDGRRYQKHLVTDCILQEMSFDEFSVSGLLPV